jgi:aminoglycoside phosphotransferase family enzyme/predicted kinase
MSKSRNNEARLAQSERLVEALQAPEAYPHSVEQVRMLETHISWVLLTGRYAYKLKKPLALDFLDFSTLERRRHFCNEELRLNRRTAAALYADVVPITGSVEHPKVGGEGAPIEYAVKMIEFPGEKQLDRLLVAGGLEREALRDFAASLAAFHAAASREESRRYGGADTVSRRMQSNLEQLEALLEDGEREHLAAVREWLPTQLETYAKRIDARVARFVRECHGDLHLSNLVMLDDGIAAFDCIEFDPALRWIDVIDDVSFLLMDLRVRGRDDLGYAFADAYLAASGDYAGACLLDLYGAHRSLVRAKVAAIGRQQAGRESKREFLDRLRSHLELAIRYTEPRRARLVLMSGVSASGKSWIAERLVSRIMGLRLRSDLERKRLAGIEPTASSESPVGGGLYTEARNRETYDRLRALARILLEARNSVIVDAAFLERAQRETFYALAAEHDASCIVIECDAPREVLEQRIEQRASKPSVSEAGADVLRAQLQSREPIAEEQVHVIRLDTAAATDLDRLAERIRDVDRAAP